MIAANEEAMVCDLAETYGIFDYRGLPVSLLATLAVGLRDDSRIKMHLTGAKCTRSDMMLAAIIDRLSLLVWGNTENGRRGLNPPKSLLDVLMNHENNGPVEAFATADDYEAEWEKITGVRHHGN